jgi:hypothetical protein
MNKTPFAVTIFATILAAIPLHAGVKINTEPSGASSQTTATATAPAAGPVEKKVAFVTAEKKYLTANTGGALDLSGVKVGSKQTFTIVDQNGGSLADGDEVKIRYTPNSGGVPDPSKATYWHEGAGGIKRSKQGDTFKLKVIDSKYAFQTLAGKFVSATVTEGALGLADKPEGALVVEVVELP